jgi:twinkle protein
MKEDDMTVEDFDAPPISEEVINEFHSEANDEFKNYVKRPDEYFAQVADIQFNPHKAGAPLPWQFKFRNSDFRFRPAEITVWAGANATGKSMLTSQLAIELSAAGEPCCLASFEMAGGMTAYRLMRQLVGIPTDEEEARTALLSLRNRIWIFDQQRRVTYDEMYKLAYFCAKKLHVKHLFIDSLMMCVDGTDDYNGQKNFVYQLTQIAQHLEIHIHLIAHMRKGSVNAKVNEEQDNIAGTGAITDLAFNVFTITPNREKKAARLQGDINRLNELAKEYDIIMKLTKHRNGETMGAIMLWRNNDYLSYCDNPELIPPAAQRSDLKANDDEAISF